MRTTPIGRGDRHSAFVALKAGPSVAKSARCTARPRERRVAVTDGGLRRSPRPGAGRGSPIHIPATSLGQKPGDLPVATRLQAPSARGSATGGSCRPESTHDPSTTRADRGRCDRTGGSLHGSLRLLSSPYVLKCEWHSHRGQTLGAEGRTGDRRRAGGAAISRRRRRTTARPAGPPAAAGVAAADRREGHQLHSPNAAASAGTRMLPPTASRSTRPARSPGLRIPRPARC